MKKSKIIVPALGILLLSTAASVSGTVAWFTASRTVSTTVSKFSVGQLDGSLSADLVEGTGTDVSGSAVTFQSTVSAANKPSILTHASYNHSTGYLYTADSVGNDGTSSSFRQLGADVFGNESTSPWATDTVDTSGRYFYAVSWKVQLKYTYAADQRDVHLFFNAEGDASEATVPDQSRAAKNGSDKETSKGIRFAFYNGSNNVVWAPLTTLANTAPGYCTSPSAKTTYTSGDLIDSNGLTKLGDTPVNKASASARADYLGTVKYSTAVQTPADSGIYVSTLEITCVAWLEGNDPNVISDARFDNVQATVSFYCRTSSATNEA